MINIKTLVCYIGYATVKDLSYLTINRVNPLYLIINKINGYIVIRAMEINIWCWLLTDENKVALKKLWGTMDQ